MTISNLPLVLARGPQSAQIRNLECMGALNREGSGALSLGAKAGHQASKRIKLGAFAPILCTEVSSVWNASQAQTLERLGGGAIPRLP